MQGYRTHNKNGLCIARASRSSRSLAHVLEVLGLTACVLFVTGSRPRVTPGRNQCLSN